MNPLPLVLLLAAGNPSQIVSGTDAGVGELPFVTTVISGARCTGSLIGEDTVLTAAHCIKSTLATVSLSTVSGTRKEQRFYANSKCIAVHPEYDAAIVTLDKRIPIRPLPLAPPGTSMDVGLAAGYGRTDHEQPGGSSVLQKLPVTIRGSHTLYAGDRNGHPSFGDSGGPLMVWTLDEWAQVGVASRLDRHDKTGFYVSIGSIRDWIWNNPCSGSEEPIVETPEPGSQFSGEKKFQDTDYEGSWSVEVSYEAIPGEKNSSRFGFRLAHTYGHKRHFRVTVYWKNSAGEKVGTAYPLSTGGEAVKPGQTPRERWVNGTAPPEATSVEFKVTCQ